MLASLRVPINNTDVAFVIVYFCPQGEYIMCVKKSPTMYVLDDINLFV